MPDLTQKKSRHYLHKDTSHFLNMEDELKVFKGNGNIVTDLSVIQMKPLVSLYLNSLQ